MTSLCSICAKDRENEAPALKGVERKSKEAPALKGVERVDGGSPGPKGSRERKKKDRYISC